jgi:hypothetical protein
MSRTPKPGVARGLRLGELFGRLYYSGDDYKRVGLRLCAYDTALLIHMVERIHAKDWDALLDVVRSLRPLWRITRAEEEARRSRLDRMRQIGIEDMVRREEETFDPFAFIEGAQKRRSLEEDAYAALDLAIRDILDISHDAYDHLRWLLWVARGAPEEAGELSPIPFFGARILEVNGERLFASSEYGSKLPNFYPADELGAPLATLDTLRTTPLFGLEAQWRLMLPTFHTEQERSWMSGEEERPAILEQIQSEAGWRFVTAMHNQRHLFKKMEKLYRKAKKYAWGVFAFDALDP